MTFKSTIHSFLISLAAIAAGCSQDAGEALHSAASLDFEVADSGFDSGSRAVENGFATEFTAGDACGVYIVRGSAIVAENVRLTATGQDGAIAWQPQTPLFGGLPDESYYVYYPYRADMAGKVNPDATDAEGFFAPLASAWEVSADQSDYASYTASDLMTAKGTAKRSGGKWLISFAMTHRMALAVIEMPMTRYTYPGTSIPDYESATLAVPDFSLSGAKAFARADGTYRYIANPAKAGAGLSGSYFNGQKVFTLDVDGIAPGSFRTFRVDGGAGQLSDKRQALAVGDFFCKDSDGGWYIIPQEEEPDGHCIGVVFHAGLHATDNIADYRTILSDGGQQLPERTFHGYAVALTETHNNGEDISWQYNPDGLSDVLVGASSSMDDWNGYANCLKIREFVNANDRWELTNFRAACVCIIFGTRDFYFRYGSTIPSTAYEWQRPYIAPAATSGWFLPSAAQLHRLWEHFYSGTVVKKSVERAGGSAMRMGRFGEVRYWSSTETSGSTAVDKLCAWGENLSESKDHGWSVRAILAF